MSSSEPSKEPAFEYGIFEVPQAEFIKTMQAYQAQGFEFVSHACFLVNRPGGKVVTMKGGGEVRQILYYSAVIRRAAADG